MDTEGSALIVLWKTSKRGGEGRTRSALFCKVVDLSLCENCCSQFDGAFLLARRENRGLYLSSRYTKCLISAELAARATSAKRLSSFDPSTLPRLKVSDENASKMKSIVFDIGRR